MNVLDAGFRKHVFPNLSTVMLHEKDYHIYHEWPCLENLETGLKETDGKQVANAA